MLMHVFRYACACMAYMYVHGCIYNYSKQLHTYVTTTYVPVHTYITQ